MGQYRSQPDKVKHTVVGQNDRFVYAASGMCGWRLNMQDAHIVNPNFKNKDFGLFAVFDGHGGEQVAKFTEKHFPIQLLNNQNFNKGLYQKALVETFLKMDQLLLSPEGKKQIKEIQKLNNKHQGQDSYAGCTANVCLITDKQLYVANAGDSRSIAVFRGKTQQMSIDHKPDDQIELKRITNAGGSVYEGRVNGNLNLSRAIGDLQYKSNSKIKPQEQIISAKPDVKKLSLNVVDFIIIGCDGIWQCKTNQQIGKYYEDGIRNKKSLKQINESLLDALLAKDTSGETGLDNMTLISVQLRKK